MIEPLDVFAGCWRGIQQEKAVHATCKFLFDELGDANIPYLPVAHYKSLYIVAENIRPWRLSVRHLERITSRMSGRPSVRSTVAKVRLDALVQVSRYAADQFHLFNNPVVAWRAPPTVAITIASSVLCSFYCRAFQRGFNNVLAFHSRSR